MSLSLKPTTFRSRPVAQLIGSVDADLAMITADIENCDLPDGRPKQPCFRFTACVRYLGRFVSSTVGKSTVDGSIHDHQRMVYRRY